MDVISIKSKEINNQASQMVSLQRSYKKTQFRNTAKIQIQRAPIKMQIQRNQRRNHTNQVQKVTMNQDQSVKDKAARSIE